VQTGDRVLVRNVTPQGKLDDRWSEEVYIVTSQPSEEAPVYHVVQEGRRGRPRTLHRNLLLPLGEGGTTETTDAVAAKDATPTPADEAPPQALAPPAVKAEAETQVDKDNAAQGLGAAGPAPGDVIADGGDADLPTVKSEAAETSFTGEEDTATGQHDSDAEAEVKSEPDSVVDVIEEASDSDSVENSEPSENSVHESDSDDNPLLSPPTSPTPVRPQRARRPPAWLASGDYQVNTNQTVTMDHVKDLLDRLKQKYKK
jgi:hypothetical protein